MVVSEAPAKGKKAAPAKGNAKGNAKAAPAKGNNAKPAQGNDAGNEGGAENNKELQENLKKVWDVKVSQCVQALQQQGYEVKPEDISGITTQGDGKPVQIQAKVKKDGQEAFLMMTQNGDIAQGDGKGNAKKETMVTAADA